MNIFTSIKNCLVTFAFIFPSLIYAANHSDSEKPIGIVLAAGDISTCGNQTWHKYANKTAEIINNVVKESNNANPPIPVRVIALGDLAYENGTKEQFKCFQSRWSGFDDILLPVPGNHEYKTDKAKPYFDHFSNNPHVTQNGSNTGYYTLNFPTNDSWLLIGLNSQLQGIARKEQLGWLKKQVDVNDPANKQECVLAFWHAPTFSSGRHGHDYKTGHNAPLTKERPMQDALRVLYSNGTSMVLTGHDHDYEQFSPHDADGKAMQDGIRSFVVGTGGALLTNDKYDNLAENSEGLYGNTKGVQGVLKVNLYKNHYDWDFIPIDENRKFQLKTTSSNCRTRTSSP